MAARKRTKFERERDLARTARLYLQGKNQYEIADEIGVAQQQISYDLKIIQRRWQRSAIMDLNEAKARELARIDHLEREYWEAWENSKLEKKVTETERNAGDAEARAKLRREDRDGNPAFLQGVQWCVEQRCKLLGLYEANKLLIEGQLEIDDLRERIYQRLLAAVEDAEGEAGDGQVGSGFVADYPPDD